MIINHNIQSISIYRNLKITNSGMDKTHSKLSSALRITKAGDDASGLAVSEKMRSQIRGLNRAAQNTQDGISMIQTADGYLDDAQAITLRLRELAVQASNGIYTGEDRLQLQVEVSQLVDELDRIASNAQFNAVNLFTGKFSRIDFDAPVNTGSMWFHVGANMDQRQRVYLNTMTSKALGLRDVRTGELFSIGTQNKANKAIGVLDLAIKRLSKERADLGATQNRLEATTKGIMISSENAQTSESGIRDADVAKEMTNYVTGETLTRFGTNLLTKSHQIRREVVERMVLR
jgi:flagellin